MAAEKSIKALLDHIGIEVPEGAPIANTNTLSHLMNFSLQCLGGVRYVLHILEKENSALTALYEPADNGLSDTKEVFSAAVTSMLVTSRSDLDPARHLVESFPDATRLSNPNWLKLHWAIVCNEKLQTPVETTKRLAAADHSSINDLDRERRSILHYAARMDSLSLLKVVAALSDPSRGGLGPRFTNNNGAVPLHNAARFARSEEVYKQVLSLWPEALRVPNDTGTLPLHWASAKNSNVEIVKLIMKSYPEALKTANKEGCLPLHTAAQNTCLAVVKAVHEGRLPDSDIQALDMEGGLPLHHACCMNSSTDVISYLYEAWPNAICTPQSDGVLPLHLAASKNGSAEVMRQLLAAYPQGAEHRDSAGWLPLHCLLGNKPSDMRKDRLDCLRLLLKVHPMGLRVQSLKGLTPYELAVKKGQHKGVIRLLLRTQPELDPQNLADLNWGARREAMLLMVRVHADVTDGEADGPLQKRIRTDTAELTSYGDATIVARQFTNGHIPNGHSYSHTSPDTTEVVAVGDELRRHAILIRNVIKGCQLTERGQVKESGYGRLLISFL